jgi:hypothetical protein
MEHFEVIGDVEADMHGDILGDILGAAAPGAPPGQMVRVPRRPGWRHGQWAPGVNAPQEGQVPLQMTPSLNNGVFTAAVTTITFTGRLQKPYRAERLIVTSSPIGTSAQGLQILGQIFVGVDLQQATTQAVNLTALGANTAFGVRMTLQQAPPGVEISMTTTVFPAPPTGTDSLGITILWLGRIIH